jgi:hypothetical protein
LAISVVVLVFFAVLGGLAILYTLHFRRRALAMGTERLRSALSRTVSGGEEATELELSQGISELEARLNRALYVLMGILVPAARTDARALGAVPLPHLHVHLRHHAQGYRAARRQAPR